MTPDEFYRGLEALGFTDCGALSPKAPDLRSYDPPERMSTVLSSVNIGRTVFEHSTKYSVTLQASRGSETQSIEGEPVRIWPEFGSAFGPILFAIDQALLEALALDANQLLKWIDLYPIFSFRMARADRPNDLQLHVRPLSTCKVVYYRSNAD